MAVPTTSWLSPEDVQNVRTLESTKLSPATAVVDVRSFVARRHVVEHGWDDFREPYSPWTGLKTAVALAAMLTVFVVYIVVRARCSPAWRRHQLFLDVRRTVKSLTPSCLLPRHMKNSCDEDDARRQSPIIVESSKRCLERLELELVEVIGDQNSTSCGRSVDVS